MLFSSEFMNFFLFSNQVVKHFCYFSTEGSTLVCIVKKIQNNSTVSYYRSLIGLYFLQSVMSRVLLATSFDFFGLLFLNIK